MAMSFYDEVQALLVHGLEQTELFHQTTREGRETAMPYEVVPMLLEMIANQGKILLKIAREIDELRAATGSG